MPIVGPPPGEIAIGTEVVFADVPEGAAVTINGTPHGTMDASGHLELSPASTGLFTVTFALAGHMDWGQTIDIVAGNRSRRRQGVRARPDRPFVLAA